jgi:hypothetical protein
LDFRYVIIMYVSASRVVSGAISDEVFCIKAPSAYGVDVEFLQNRTHQSSLGAVWASRRERRDL